MATVEIADGRLTVSIEGWDRVWALRGQLSVPLEHVSGASSGEAAAREWYKGIRLGAPTSRAC
jgi:hypothetical protein